MDKTGNIGKVSEGLFFPGCDIKEQDGKFYFLLEQGGNKIKIELTKVQYEALKQAKLQENKEIEGKYLLNYIPENISSNKYFGLEQSYLYIGDKDEVRIRKKEGENTTYSLTIKSGNGTTRGEYEVAISKEQYDILMTFHIGEVIRKTRFEIIEGDKKVEVDVYSDGNVVAEVEFNSEEEKKEFEKNMPDWIGSDVSTDKRLKNKILAQKGFPPIYTDELRRQVLEQIESIMSKK